MEPGNHDCEHRCRNTCALLSEAMQDEKRKVAYYEDMLSKCDDPAVKNFVKELVESHRVIVARIAEKLDIIHTNAEVLDNIMTSFEG
jgi:rubrerythrin